MLSARAAAQVSKIVESASLPGQVHLVTPRCLVTVLTTWRDRGELHNLVSDAARMRFRKKWGVPNVYEMVVTIDVKINGVSPFRILEDAIVLLTEDRSLDARLKASLHRGRGSGCYSGRSYKSV